MDLPANTVLVFDQSEDLCVFASFVHAEDWRWQRGGCNRFGWLERPCNSWRGLAGLTEQI